jgi:hypothetical protein
MKTAFQHLMQDAHLINTFAGEDALPKKVLIDIGDGACIDIKAGFAGVKGRQA